jgi:hypothetical protein
VDVAAEERQPEGLCEACFHFALEARKSPDYFRYWFSGYAVFACFSDRPHLMAHRAAGTCTEYVTALDHLTALQVERDLRQQDALAAEEKLQNERDRRYAEVALEREKALKIKETADLAALQLAREIQTYKDEKANELRSQIERERGTYATQSDLKSAVEKVEALVKPLAEWAASQQGRSTGLSSAWVWLVGAVATIAFLSTHVKFH